MNSSVRRRERRVKQAADDRSDPAVRRDDAAQRYELVANGEVIGSATYHLRDGAVVVPHTEIDAHRRGRGLGALMVKGVLDDLDARGLTVVPSCPFVARYIDDHPEYAHLVA
jgi:predicted GNAT family acetyltransferase